MTALSDKGREVLYEHVKPTLAEVPAGESWWLPDAAIIEAMLAFREEGRLAALDEAARVIRAEAPLRAANRLATSILALKDKP